MLDLQYYQNSNGEIFNLRTIPCITLDTKSNALTLANGTTLEDFYDRGGERYIFMSWLWGKMQTEERFITFRQFRNYYENSR